MSFNQNDIVSASDFISLKARVKAELTKRCRNGDISRYGGAAYDYTISPASKQPILVEHINKLVEPLNAVNSIGMTNAIADSTSIENLIILDAKLTGYESDVMTYNGHNSCAASCSGMCVSGCWNNCTGCGGICSSSCSGDCEGGCSGTCSGSCTGCSGTCSGSCTGCSGTCSNTCTGCGGYCGGCSGTCTATCANSCFTGNYLS